MRFLSTIWIYVERNSITKPIKKPEKISPKGIRDMGMGPKVYKIPTAKEIAPMIKTTGEVLR